MSYDVRLQVPTGNGEFLSTECLNYTWNCAPMFCDVLKGGINGLHNLTGKKAGEALHMAIDLMRADPARYKAMDPKNSWGDYTSALQWLEDILSECKKHPEGIVNVT